jgi:predicted nucleic acid-binding protein
MILLDTSVLIEAFASDGEVRERLRGAIEDGHRMALPTLVLYEWLRGPRTPGELEAQEALFPSDQSIPFGPLEAAKAAELYQAVPRPRGREIDLAIAGCAIAWNASLWTLNPGDFGDVPGVRAWTG